MGRSCLYPDCASVEDCGLSLPCFSLPIDLAPSADRRNVRMALFESPNVAVSFTSLTHSRDCLNATSKISRRNQLSERLSPCITTGPATRASSTGGKKWHVEIPYTIQF